MGGGHLLLPARPIRIPTMEASAAMVLLLALCLSCLFLLLLLQGRWDTKSRLPPGPRPFPFIGNLPHLDAKNMIKSLLELSRQYGSLFTIHMGSRPVVVLCGYQMVKEALVDQGEEFSGRGDMPVLFRFTQGNGIAFSNGEKWKILRRFAIQTLRDFGMGKRSIEERIQEEAQCLVKELAKRTEPFDPTFLLGCSVSNVICSIVFGNRFDYEDQQFLTFIGLVNDNFRLFSSPCAQMYNIFPHIMYYLPGPHNQIFANFEKLRALVKEMAKAHQASLDPSCPRDFIDSFLLKMEQEKGDSRSFFHTDTLIMTTHNLFFAGTETISTTLRYAILILMKFPEVAAKVQEEIAKVIGSERLPSVADRAKMPYTEAVIHEVQRFADIIPMGIPHALTKDTHFRGFFFPEGTNVLPFFHSVHQDPSQFKNPEMFDPGHFLDEEGAFRRSNAFMPFSAGKRLCLGEALARMELFLFLTALLQRFSFQPSCPRDQLDLSPLASGIGNVPRPYTCRPLAR
ncbi:cytochrome P450 2F5-like isoform X1 [Ahaetulla prasina]|uniref:cytochrome P450 2F5-like isoform X1 n=1 Tax=Ahaetulla prasina TaxID=499056 RepID=UPI002647300F|nr:cytochrome P450 2F5-like isoform X1 [Ahaetulla prasina]